MTKVILASQSPRRSDLLRQMGVDFVAVPSDFEEYLDDNRSPYKVSIELGLGKARAVAEKYPDRFVIGSDCIVSLGSKQFAKAESIDEARSMLRQLAGKPNTVTSSVVILRNSDHTEITGADAAIVYFRPYDDRLVEQYLATGDYKDKAAAYGIQSGAAPLIDYFVGNYDTILGLPTKLLHQFLAQLNIDSKPVRLEATVECREH